jgi:tRNA-uridine 2-sulfurtransferase
VRHEELALIPPGEEAGVRGVLVGMSGGVDSSVAALRLLEQGFYVVGVTFRLWSDPVCATGRTCCSPETIIEARRLAHRLGIPHLTVDLSPEFYREVVSHFVEEYAAARTPNPCVRCNSSLRFAELARLADRLGLAWVATGHYARLGDDGRRLERGRDPRKDQSYVLARVDPGLLTRARFPLGDLTKDQTRALARSAGLEVHDAPESQEICFIPDDDYRRFLRERLGERPGRLVDTEGAVVGQHRGFYNFTVGQRRGLGLAAPEPYYVVALKEDDVVVGPAQATEVRRVWVQDLVLHRPQVPARAHIQVRSSGRPVPASNRLVAPDRLLVVLDEPIQGVAPGQTAVLYEGEAVAVAGVITAAERGAVEQD